MMIMILLTYLVDFTLKRLMDCCSARSMCGSCISYNKNDFVTILLFSFITAAAQCLFPTTREMVKKPGKNQRSKQTGLHLDPAHLFSSTVHEL